MRAGGLCEQHGRQTEAAQTTNQRDNDAVVIGGPVATDKTGAADDTDEDKDDGDGVLGPCLDGVVLGGHDERRAGHCRQQALATR